MKRFAFIFGIVLIAAVLVAAGFWLGRSRNIMAGAWSVTALDNAITHASIREAVLQDLDAGHVDQARSLLRTLLDGDIIEILVTRDYADARNRETATDILTRIAVERTKYPAYYTNRADEAYIDAKIASILEQAKKATTK